MRCSKNEQRFHGLLTVHSFGRFYSLLVYLTKTKAGSDFGSLRWICKSAVLQKWYLRALRPRLRDQLRLSPMHSYGFRRYTSTAEVTGLVRELLYIAHTWGLPLLLTAQDVRMSFDSMPHGLIAAALRAKGVSYPNTGLHMRELTGLQARISHPLVGVTAPFKLLQKWQAGWDRKPRRVALSS